MTEMIRHWTNSRGPLAARLALAAALAAAFVLLVSLKAGFAAEWSVPPGVNVAAQQSVLRERIVRAASGILGQELVDVTVEIGYLRTAPADSPSQPSRVKLPGFSNYIQPTAAGAAPEIHPEFSRVRQALVMIADTSKTQPESLARELAALAGMDPSQGDTLRVVRVAASQREQEGMPAMPGLKPREPGSEEAQAEPAKPARPMTPAELKEPQSTAHLMQARRYYFAGDYQGALDEIMRAITIDSNNAQAYAMLGSLYYAMNWRNLAVKYWQRSLEIDPANREVEDLVAQIRMQSP